MKKPLKYSIWALLIIYLLTNYTPISYLLKEDYTYSNVDGSYTDSEEGGKGNTYETVIRRYATFLCRHPDKDTGDNHLYRTFTIKPWCIWEWHDMIFHSERFWLPYKRP
ncbi:hypothetical protein C8P68_102906 [Mucilaginibacter yixingensis]|uniref:Uncharacterized protein n=1 Tax=Mucilaginibacter yixingensis TaxID=1295612 RepID=A0A2T5JE94_9SPHI|nr:hypothetical protein [Mucilaginibacter yixingensis]PTR00074.1 hypothetical protein C8P68_102906 [Mucilaginibacter yixingensis]